jgi:hypothetical protein
MQNSAHNKAPSLAKYATNQQALYMVFIVSASYCQCTAPVGGWKSRIH